MRFMLKILFHIFMTWITGGIWLIGVIIYCCMKRSRR